MKQEGLKERVELLEAGETLGYPRLGYGRSTKIPHDKRIPPGKDGWERFCAHAHIKRVLPALRIARVLRDNGVTPFNPPAGADLRGEADKGAGASSAAAPTGEHDQALLNDEESRLGLPPQPDLLGDVDLPAKEAVVPLPRPKKGGHKKPPHPLSKRARRG